MSKPLKPIPEFRSEDEERDFWGAKGRDSTEYIDWSKARLARFPNIKLSTRSISLRLPLSLLERIKLEANKRDVPYQSLIKVWLAEKAFVGSDTRAGDVARHSKRLLREHLRGK
jgi:predicted DNA binding CopG/RHH family protein